MRSRARSEFHICQGSDILMIQNRQNIILLMHVLCRTAYVVAIFSYVKILEKILLLNQRR